MKKLLKFKTLYIGLFIVTGTLLTSCSNHETYDFPGDSKSRVYIATNGGVNVTTYQVLQTPVGAIGNVKLKIPIHCTQRMNSNTKVTVALDNSLIATFNTKNGTNYVQAPDGSVTIENSTVTIPADSLISKDSVTVSIPKDALPKLTESGGYLIPVVIKSADGANSAVSVNMSLTYVAVAISTDKDNIWDTATSSNIAGSLVSSRTNWTATLNLNGGTQYSMSGSADKMFDGIESYSSRWYCYASKNPTITIDLGQEYNVTGLYISPTSPAKNSVFSLSKDGQTWSEQGKVSSSVNNVIFYSAVTARYIKWDLGTYYWSIYEFNIYAK